MIPRIIKVICFIVFSTGYVFPQQISKFEIIGEQILAEEEYQTILSKFLNQRLEESTIDSIHANLYLFWNNNGFFDAEILNDSVLTTNDTSSIAIALRVNEGEPCLINNILYELPSDLDSIFFENKFKFIRDTRFDKILIEETFDEILTQYENIGFPFLKISVSSIHNYKDEEGNSYVDLNLSIDKSIESKIDEIKIVGNESTKDYVIIRNLRLDDNLVYSQSLIENIPPKLNKLQFFEPVSAPQYYLNSENKGVLEISIKEKQTNNFDGIIGYVPGNKNDEKGFFTGFVNISLKNLFGTERAASIKWQQLQRDSRELELKYKEPWLFGYPLNFGVELFQRKQDTTYIQNRFWGDLEFLATESISASFIFQSESTIPSDDTTKFTVYNSSSVTTGLNLKIDLRDDVLAPTSGVLFETGYKFSSKKINGPAKYLTEEFDKNTNLQRIEIVFQYFYEIFNRQILTLALHGKQVKGDLIEISDLYKLGGTNSLRGFRENQFLGEKIFWSNFEYRYLLTKRTYAFTFFDTGYFENSISQSNGDKLTEFNYGFGFGLSIDTAVGILGVSYALAKGSAFSEGLIHFGIINEF